MKAKYVAVGCLFHLDQAFYSSPINIEIKIVFCEQAKIIENVW
jgi:hypothetical protein